MAVPRRPRPEANEGDPGHPFDLNQLRQVIEMMDKHGLTELSLRNGAVQWRLRRGGPEAPVMAYAAPPPMMQAATAPRAAPDAPAPAPVNDGLIDIKSPTVGTFYTSPAPDEPAYVGVGSKVTPTTVVCLIEAMKVFNQIAAEVSGTIAAVLVKSGEPVEFGQPLFKVRP